MICELCNASLARASSARFCRTCAIHRRAEVRRIVDDELLAMRMAFDHAWLTGLARRGLLERGQLGPVWRELVGVA